MANVMDPDPAKLYGSFGSGSATLLPEDGYKIIFLDSFSVLIANVKGL